jgi:hypothetical protein
VDVLITQAGSIGDDPGPGILHWQLSAKSFYQIMDTTAVPPRRAEEEDQGRHTKMSYRNLNHITLQLK